MNNILISSGHGTALLVLEVERSFDPDSISKIGCRRRSTRANSTKSEGSSIGQALGPTSALVVKVVPHCLVEISGRIGKPVESNHPIHVDGSFEITRLKSGIWPLSEAQIDLLLPTPSLACPSLKITDEDLTLIFSARQPPWLQKIIDTQLQNWRVHHVAKFFQFTPWRLESRDLTRCVKGAPFWALARWQKQLHSRQIDYCYRMLPCSGVAFGLTWIPKHSRQSDLERFPKEALLYAAEELTNQEFLGCSSLQPETAFEEPCRRKLHPARRAELWPEAYRKISSWPGFEPPPGLQKEILANIATYPAAWLAAHKQGFSEIFRGLDSHLSIRPEAEELLEMHRQMENSGREHFNKYLGAMI